MHGFMLIFVSKWTCKRRCHLADLRRLFPTQTSKSLLCVAKVILYKGENILSK